MKLIYVIIVLFFKKDRVKVNTNTGLSKLFLKMNGSEPINFPDSFKEHLKCLINNEVELAGFSGI